MFMTVSNIVSDQIMGVLRKTNQVRSGTCYFQNLPAVIQFPWEAGKKNRMKNRYGNITTCEYTFTKWRVLFRVL